MHDVGLLPQRCTKIIAGDFNTDITQQEEDDPHVGPVFPCSVETNNGNFLQSFASF